MTSIVMLTPDEKFLQFLDPDLCSIKETATAGGLRTIDLDYKFQDYKEDKQLFKIGNKLWITGDLNLTPCLYVINTKVTEDIYVKNNFEVTLEEVLVELNNAPLTSHLDLTAHSSVFKTRTTNDALEVKIDWNCLNYWFGDFFNIGVVQDCLNASVQWIPFFGTYNKMNLLRYIEEQTGNVFVTRYEKDLLNNTIHRYLDFLNPLNVSKDWELHIEYDFYSTAEPKFYDENDNEVSEDRAWEVKRYTNSHINSESLNETVSAYDATTDEALNQYDTLDSSYQWIAEDELVVDEGTIKNYKSITNIDPANIQFQITDSIGEILNADGTVYESGDDNALIWTPSDLSYTSSDTHAVITLAQTNNKLGMCTHNKTFVVLSDYGEKEPYYVSYSSSETSKISDSITSSNERNNCAIPDDSYFEIYDTVSEKVLFRTCINRSIGKVHSEIFDFGFNLDNISFDIDESETFSAVAPVLQYNESNGSSNSLTRSNFTDLVTRFKNLSITKGQKIPMIMQRVTVKAATLEAAKVNLGSYTQLSGANESTSKSNYWIRPYNPNDNVDSNTPANSTWEFLRATAYWNAPFTKKAGSLNVILDDIQGIEYSIIFGRGDMRDEKGTFVYEKIGTTESNDEDIYSIYNQCATYLKEHRTPNISLDVDIASLRHGQYNEYNPYDKVYVKIPDTNEVITARIVETTKESHNVAANSIKLNNYTVNTVKTVTSETIIRASNISYKYPKGSKLTARLENLNYDNTNIYSVQYPANKLIEFVLYKIKDGNRTFRKVYTKITNANGYAELAINLNPGDYEIDLMFGGDEEYQETTTTVKINVSGTVETATKTASTSQQKTTAKTTKTTKTTYYDKYGRSPDKKKILAIGKISASGDQGSYANYYGMEFKNKCPHCGKQSLVWGIFWAGEHKNYGYFDGTKGKEGGSIEGHIFCTHCDADYSCQGREHVSNGKKLTSTKSRFKSSKADAYKLRKGKYVFNKKTSTTDSKTVTNNKDRKVVGKPSSKIKNLALSIVGNKTGYAAMKAIVAWMDKNIFYSGYGGFKYSADSVYKKKRGNCCDGTRLFLELCDSAGLTEFYNMYYCHVPGHVYAIVQAKSTKKKTYVDCASDVHSAWGYVCQGYQRGSPTSKYPKRPI